MHALFAARGSNLTSHPCRTVRIVALPFKKRTARPRIVFWRAVRSCIFDARRDHTLSFGTRRELYFRISATLRRTLRGSTSQGTISLYPASVHCVRSILTYRGDFRHTLQIERRKTQSTPLFKRAFYSRVSRSLSTRAAAL